MERGTMTWMILLLLLMGLSLASVAVTSLIVLLKLQGKWMRAFGEQHGIQALNTDGKPAEPFFTAPKKEKPKVSIPLPGADLLRQMRKPNG